MYFEKIKMFSLEVSKWILKKNILKSIDIVIIKVCLKNCGV